MEEPGPKSPELDKTTEKGAQTKRVVCPLPLCWIGLIGCCVDARGTKNRQWKVRLKFIHHQTNKHGNYGDVLSHADWATSGDFATVRCTVDTDDATSQSSFSSTYWHEWRNHCPSYSSKRRMYRTSFHTPPILPPYNSTKLYLQPRQTNPQD